MNVASDPPDASHRQAVAAHVTELFFSQSSALFASLALHVANHMEAAVRLRGHATVVVPGGRSAPAFLAALRDFDLPWKNVTFTLSDERWVEASNPESNEALVERHLLQGAARHAKFFGLYRPGVLLERAPAYLDDESRSQLMWPPDFTVLGMGEDGHTASIFPSSPAEELAQALSPAPPTMRYAAAHPQGSPLARLSLTMPALLKSRRIALLIPGAAKWSTYRAATQAGPATALPVRGIVHEDGQPKPPVEVWWSP